MEIIQAVRGGTIKITGIVFTDRDVTITDRGKPFTAPIGKSPIELSSLEKIFWGCSHRYYLSSLCLCFDPLGH